MIKARLVEAAHNWRLGLGYTEPRFGHFLIHPARRIPVAEPDSTSDTRAVIDGLIEALRGDEALRDKTRERLVDALGIDPRQSALAAGADAAAVSAESIKARRKALELRADLWKQRREQKRVKWYSFIAGGIAATVGAILFWMVWQMMGDMDRMEVYMYNMGHSPDDGAVAVADERKTRGQSFMLTMARDMNQMRDDMTSMNVQMIDMRGSMGVMRGSIVGMDKTMGNMSGDMGQMSKDINTMNASMARMQYDTLLMRQGVGNMATDTGAMSLPFRAMDNFIPFR